MLLLVTSSVLGLAVIARNLHHTYQSSKIFFLVLHTNAKRRCRRLRHRRNIAQESVI